MPRLGSFLPRLGSFVSSVRLVCVSVRLVCVSVRLSCASDRIVCASVSIVCALVRLVCASIRLVCVSVGLVCVSVYAMSSFSLHSPKIYSGIHIILWEPNPCNPGPSEIFSPEHLKCKFCPYNDTFSHLRMTLASRKREDKSIRIGTVKNILVRNQCINVCKTKTCDRIQILEETS